MVRAAMKAPLFMVRTLHMHGDGDNDGLDRENITLSLLGEGRGEGGEGYGNIWAVTTCRRDRYVVRSMYDQGLRR